MNLRNLILIVSIGAHSSLQANIDVLARFEPSRIALGDTSNYVVEIIESSTDTMPQIEPVASMPIPQVNGLTFRNGYPSTSQQTNILNGRIKHSITQKLIIDAIPASTGTYMLPSYSFEYKGTRLQVPAATLSVVERSETPGSTLDEMVSLTLEVPEQLYVGQTVSTSLKLYVKEGVQLRGLNSFDRRADGFTVNGGPPEDAIEDTDIVNGRRYKVYSWPLIITPIRAGSLNLNFELGVTGQLPNQQSNNRHRPFGNSIFDDFFGRTERLNIYSKPTKINVIALPTENQPESFSGAIGKFNLEVSADSESTRVGEPIMLSLKITGQGNFDRIQGPKLPATSSWRSYAPESVFELDKSQPLKGTKRFDYVFVPEKSGTLELPEVSFSFFDPEIEEYVELAIPAITVEVAPGKRLMAPVTSSENGIAKVSNEPVKSLNLISSEDLLLTLDYQIKSGRKIVEYSIPRALFYSINGTLFVVLCITVFSIYRKRQNVNSPYYKLVCDAKTALKTALRETQSNDSATFFSSAQKAVRLAATVRSKQNLLTADFSTLETIFRQIGLTETVIDQARVLFQTAEAHRFSGNCPTVNLSEHRNQLKTILNTLS